MRKKRKKEKTGLVLRQQMVLGGNEDKEISVMSVYAVHGLLLFVWVAGCLKWIDEVLTLHIAQAPLLLAVGIFCLLFETAVRLNHMWKALGAAGCFILAYVWFARDVCLGGLNMIACQAAIAISEYYHLESDIENVTMNTDILLYDFVLLAAILILTAGAATVKLKSGTVPGMVFVMLLTASLMVDRFPNISTLLMLMTGTAGLIAVLSAGAFVGRKQKGALGSGRGYMKTGLYAVCMVLVVSGISYGAARYFVAEKMHGYYDSIKEYPQQMIAVMQAFISGRDGETSQLEQWMNGIAAGFDAKDGQLTNAAPVQTGAVVLRVDATVKPETAMYFKSYIGGNFDTGSEQWEMLNDASFQSAYANWNSASGWSYSEVKSELAMRLFECLNEAGLTESCSYHIENIRASKAYTWAPYGVDVSGTSVEADGILSGGSQTLFAGYPMFEAAKLLDTLSYRVEGSENAALFADYTDYVYDTYLEVPAGMQALREGYYRLSERYHGASAAEWIEAIRAELEDACTYESYGLTAVPEGANIIDYFYGSQKKGYCIHFASAGVMMLRLAGIPARYVSGYVAWPDDFSYDEAGECYHADITGYRGHAWVEIYDARLGIWLPVEMTPADSVQLLGPDKTNVHNDDYSDITETAEGQIEESQTEFSESETEKSQTEAVPASETTGKMHQSGGGQPGHNSENDKASEGKNGWAIPLALIVIAAIMVGIYVYNSRHSGDIRRFSRVNRNKGVLAMEWHLTEVMEMAGWSAEQNMDDWSYAQWLQEKVDTLEEGEYLFFMEKLHQAAYSEEMLSEEDYQKCYDTYKKIISKVFGEIKGIKKLWWQYMKGYKI